MPTTAPVEYAAAVERYLGQAALGPASRRVYRISLVSWSWPLVGRPAPRGAHRRGATPPLVPLARLDDPDTGPALDAALRDRAAGADVRTVNRELSALRSAVAWWQDQRWISHDPTEGLRHLAGPPPPQPVLAGDQLSRVFQAAPTLRDHALWRVLHDSAAPADGVLRLNAGSLDLTRHGGRAGPPWPGQWIGWSGASTELLRWLTAGRPGGAGLPDQPPGPGGHSRARRVPAHGAGPVVLPPRGGDIHGGDPPSRPGRPWLDPQPASPVAAPVPIRDTDGGPGTAVLEAQAARDRSRLGGTAQREAGSARRESSRRRPAGR